MKNSVNAMLLRVVLFLIGLIIMVTGINISFGGILTLGWQGSNDFVSITDQVRFNAQDSHVRFLGGVWLTIGVTFVLAALQLARFQSALRFALVATFAGGLARFTQMNLDVTLGSDILPSLIAEVIGMPLLYFWLSKVMAKNHR